MRQCNKAAIKFSLAVLPVLCIILIILSLGSLIISLSSDVKWNEYDEYDARYDLYSYYFSTIWSSLDGFWYATISGKYYQMLTLKRGSDMDHDESWKIPIRTHLFKSIGLNTGSLFLLIVDLAVHALTKKKLLTIVLLLGGCGTGIAAGYFAFKAAEMYKDGLFIAISVIVVQSKAYFPEKEQMKLGYNLVVFSAFITLFTCVLILLNTGLYAAFGDGKWIWKSETYAVSDKSLTFDNGKPKQKITKQEATKKQSNKFVDKKEVPIGKSKTNKTNRIINVREIR